MRKEEVIKDIDIQEENIDICKSCENELDGFEVRDNEGFCNWCYKWR